NRRRIRGQDGVLGHGPGEAGEDLLLHFLVFRHRLDRVLGCPGILERAGLQPRNGCLGFFALELSLAYRLVELAADAGESFLDEVGGDVDENDVDAAVVGTLATQRARRDAAARGLAELVSSGALADAPGVVRTVHLARCPPQVAHALDLGRLAPSELWCADVPLSVESDSAG